MLFFSIMYLPFSHLVLDKILNLKVSSIAGWSPCCLDAIKLLSSYMIIHEWYLLKSFIFIYKLIIGQSIFLSDLNEFANIIFL